MKLSLNDEAPIFIQIAKAIEDEILDGGIGEEEQIPSTNEIAKLYQINPATVLKGINLLVEREILYKKRGIGMFVRQGAVGQIRNERKEHFKEVVLTQLIREAQKLAIDKEELIQLIQTYEEEK